MRSHTVAARIFVILPHRLRQGDLKPRNHIGESFLRGKSGDDSHDSSGGEEARTHMAHFLKEHQRGRYGKHTYRPSRERRD